MEKVCRLTEAISGTGGGRPKSLIAAIAVAVALIAVTVVSFANVARAAGVVGTTVVDPDTTNVWTNYTRPGGQPSTQNVGRIWTDKSVFDGDYSFTNDNDAGLNGKKVEKGDSDFLVSLSALSSTSNLKEMVKTSQPLDIVLVLDTSGSMSGSKMTNLKNAANSFIDATAENNRGLEQDQQTRLAIVQFASGANTRQQLSYVTDQNVQQYKNTINGFRASGATYAEEGLQRAQNVLDRNGRADVQQIVIFFTDGEPNHSNGFDNEVAAEAVNTAYEMKQGGTIIYAIGVMNGADASVTDDDGFNEYMNGVSSNYPNATADGSNGGIFGWGAHYNTTFGERAEGDYYKAASDPDSIEEIFDEISDEVQQGVGSGSPIEENTQQGNTVPGILTFEDQLGNYMQVTGTGAGKDTIQLAYGDKIYTSTSKSTEGNTDTYHFEGQVDGNEIYGAANLSDLVVTVERGDDLATGDKVTVTLPTSLLPMRHYDVDTDAGTMTVSQAYPVRLFYGVSLKAEAKTALGDPTSETYAAIVASQASDDGTSIDFYSNSFVKSAADGSTTASFSPNAGNKFYYYTQDTTLYTDPECTTEANWNTARNANTLYYKDVYWVQTGNGNGAREVTDGYGTVTSGTAEWNAIVRQGTYYIPANTQRTERPHTLTDVKESNETGTAANVLNPSWTAGGDVTQALGNNGKLSFEKPGSLEIKKNVDWGNASDQTKQDKNTFTFDITANVPTGEGEATEPLAGTYNYYVDDSETAAGQVTFNNGAATLTVTGGTTVRIDGLPAGTTFTVTEQGVGRNGWTVTDATSQEDVENNNPADGVVTGTIPAGSQASLTFSNVYHANDVNLSTDTTLKVRKNLEGRDWRDTDEFTFEIDGLGNTAGTDVITPEPADTTITVNSQTPDHTASFGDITFTMPGEYRYSIVEDNDTNPIAGIDYSGAFYRVVVTVTDNGTGSLEVSSVAIEQRTNDDGVENDPVVAVQGDTVTFVNKYDADGGTTNIDGTKAYTDNVGGNPINADKFTFKIEALGGYDSDDPQTNPYTYGVDEVPLPAGSDEASHSKTVYNTGYNFTFGTIAFDGGDLGRTYEYKVTELAQNKDGRAEAGMTYDKTEYTVKVTVTEVSDADGTHIVATPDITPQELKFTNTYDPADATLTGADAIHGTKTLTGRNMKEGETFYFQLMATNANAQSVLPNAQTVEVTSLTDGSANFDFGEMSFSKVGKYTFTVNEVADQNGTETTDVSGMTYDSNVCTVTVNVTDGHDGTLKADVTYSNSAHSSVTDKAQFNNTYKASMNYGAEGAGGIVVTKTLNDRSEANNTFLFTIKGETEEDTVKLHDQDRKFSHGPLTPGVPNEMEKLQQLTFDETDAGKTYTFIVDELEDEFGPNESADTLKGVDFDQSQYRVVIQVLDNGDGTMHTVTTVTKTMDRDGSAVNEAVYGPSDSATDGYMAPKFGFVNDYNPEPAVVGGSADAKIEVTKTVEGADSATNYTFTLTLEDQGQAQYVEGLTDGKLEVSTSGTIAEGASQTVEFGELKFTKAGSYGFTVKENQPAEDAGWTFDDENGDGATDTHHVEIVITDKNADGKYDGKLYVESVKSDAGEGQPVQITNSYKTDPVVVGGEDAEQQITVQKSVTGDNTAVDAEFNFQLEPVVDDTNTEVVWRANVEAAEAGFEPRTTITGVVTTDAPKTATFGGIRFKAAGDYTFKVTEIEGTDDQADPSGWKYDGHEAFVTVHVTDDGEGKLKATVSYNNKKATTDADKAVDNAAAFTNAYSASSTDADTGSANVQLTKVLEGKTWDGDSFTFEIKPESNTAGIETANMPMPNADADGDGSKNTVTLSAPTETDGKTAIFSFGKITFDTPGTYVYKVTEVEGDNAGITYSKNVATITITVTDNHQGALVATVSIANNVFTNTYASELDYAAGGGLKIAKTFENATMREFSFTVKPKDDASAEKLGIDMAGETFTTKPGETIGDDNASHAEVAVLDAAAEAKFTQADADDTYTYTVKETAGSDAGVTYDDTEYTVTITTADDGQGGITVTTTVTDGADYTQSYVYDNDDATENQTAVVPFTNTYKATGELGGNGSVSIKATKTLTNRPMVDGEFRFNVTNAADDSNTVVATGTNDANGTITFSAINYSIDQMLEDVDDGLATPGVADGKDTFTYTYKVTEDTASLDDGVSAIDAAGFQITVTVTDNGDGTLGIAVAYPDGSDGLTFRNTYGEGQTGQATLNINGTKTLKVASGDNAPNIEGKYTFTLTGSKGAPMPATTEAHNDAAGNVAFGDITFTMENVFGDTGSQDAATNAEGDGTEEAVSAQSAIRTKEFTYTVTESGSVAGVDNDAEASKTFTVTVTDNGDGTLSVASNPVQGALFTFTNTYSVEPEESSPTGKGGITITKNLAGRNLNEGEFTFELVDQSGATVATGTNDASGNVELSTVKFTEPGRFTYTIREAKGSLGGVGYDAAEYKATAEVKDNGDGTLAVTWSFDTAAGDPASAIEFNNAYTATPTSVLLGGTKVLDGRALAEGEFTFVLNDAGGNELQTVTNDAQGGFCFDQITYDAAGTYEYTISEVKGDAEGVTYDDATIAVKVVVTDNGKGALEVTELTYDGKTELPVFTNTYVKPVEPPKDDSGLMQTGDPTSTFVGVIAGLGALSVAVGLAARKRHGE